MTITVCEAPDCGATVEAIGSAATWPRITLGGTMLPVCSAACGVEVLTALAAARLIAAVGPDRVPAAAPGDRP